MMVEHFRQVCDLPNDTGQGVTFIVDAIIAFKQMSFIDQRVFCVWIKKIDGGA